MVKFLHAIRPLLEYHMRFACPTCSQLLECSDDLIGGKVMCGKCGQRILVPTPPPQTNAGNNKTTLGKIVDTNKTRLGEIVEEVPNKQALSQPGQIPVAFPAQPMNTSQPTDKSDEPKKSSHSKRKFRCQFCGSTEQPIFREDISLTGWIICGVMLFVFFPLCWIGLFIKENVRFCAECNNRLDRHRI